MQVVVASILLCIAQVFGRSVEPPSTSKFTPLQEQCIKQLDLDNMRDELVNFNNQEICPENHPGYNKFISCFWKKTNRQGEDGQINYDTIQLFVREGIVQALGDDAVAQQFAEQSSTKIVDKCKIIVDTDSEKLAVKVRNCIVTGLNEIGN